MSTINFDPMQTLTGQNSFQVESQGYIQGAFMDDPVARMWLLPGLVDSSVTQPIWGGLAIEELVPAPDAHTNGTIASPISIPSTASSVTGFTVFNRAHNMLIVPGQNVPLATTQMDVAYFRLGSNVRIPVKVSSGLASSLEGGSITQQVSWDFTNNELTAYVSGTNTVLPVKVLNVNSNSKIVNYNSSTGAVTWAYGYAALIQL